MKKFIAFMLTLMLALVFIGCGDEPVVTVTPTGIQIQAAATEVKVDETINLTLKFEPATVTEKAVEWASSDESIARVSNGTVKGLKAGTVTITVTAKAAPEIKGTITINVVEAAKVLPTSITVGGASELIIGIAENFWVTLKGAEGAEVTEKEVTWTSSNEAVATVTADGEVVGVAAGTATITATSAADPNVKGEKEVTVLSNEEFVPVHKLELRTDNGTTVLLTKNLTKTLKLTGIATADQSEDSTARPTKSTLEWTSSDEAIATVDAYGRVTPVAEGKVTITCTTTDGTALTQSAEITVVAAKAPTSYTVSTSVGAEGLAIGRTNTIAIKVGEGEDDSSIFTSSDENVATVDEFGTVKAIAIGTVTITATSALDATKTGSVTMEINDGTVKTEVSSVTVTGEKDVYVGYTIALVAMVQPINAPQSVTWSSSDESIATVDQTGVVTALKTGTVRITAASTANPKISDKFKVSITEEPAPEPFTNMGGYEIIIMNADSAVQDNDPFHEKYAGSDKEYKQKAWREVEANYNCKITVKPYPSTAPWGAQRINWLKDNASANTSECDLAVVSSNWIYDFAQSSACVDVTDYYNRYGKKQMEVSLKVAGSYKGKIYVASHGISPTATYVDLGLYYNLTWLQELGIEDPAQMFLDGKWTYTGFKEWVLSTQAKLNEGQFVFGGHPYYYYYGMTNAAGVQIADAVLVQTNISSPKSQAACALISELVQAGACDEVASWAESDGGFIAKTTLMTTGYLWFVRNENRWKADLFGDDTKFGYVPFPYPDDVKKEDTRIGVSGLSVLMYVAGRTYPAGVTTKDVYRAVNDMFLNTIKYQKADPDFDAVAVKRTALQSRIDNPASIDCIMYYDAAKVFYDPAHAIYSSTSATVLKAPANNVMYKGADFKQEFDAVFEAFDTAFKAIYA